MTPVFRRFAMMSALVVPLAVPIHAVAQVRVAAPADVARQIDAYLDAAVPADQPGVTVIVTRGGKTVYAGARGLADVAAHTPLTRDSVIRIGSITKQFTAAVILQLAEEGKLSLDDPLTSFFSDYPAPGGAATVRQLLNHTSRQRARPWCGRPIMPSPQGTTMRDTVSSNVTPASLREPARWIGRI